MAAVQRLIVPDGHGRTQLTTIAASSWNYPTLFGSYREETVGQIKEGAVWLQLPHHVAVHDDALW